MKALLKWQEKYVLMPRIRDGADPEIQGIGAESRAF